MTILENNSQVEPKLSLKHSSNYVSSFIFNTHEKRYNNTMIKRANYNYKTS